MNNNVSATPDEPSFNKPLLMLDPDRLKPLPKELWDMPCSACARLEAKWGFLPNMPVGESGAEKEDFKESEIEPLTLCSLCFLYGSEWGKRRRSEIDEMVRSIELELTVRMQDEHARRGSLSPEQFASLNISFPKDDSGKLTDNRDANRVVGSIAILSRMLVAKMDTADALQQKISEQRIITPDHPQFSAKKTL